MLIEKGGLRRLLGLCYGQINNNLTSQAAVMTTHGLPNDILSNLNPFSLIILIPICDKLVSLSRQTGHWSRAFDQF